MVESIGRVVLNALAETKGVIRLFFETLYWIVVGPFKKRAVSLEHVASQAVFGGVNSILIVFFVCFAMGMVLAMQSAYQLESFGALNMVAALVAVSMAREIGPVLGSLVIAGRVGAAITAEISTMKVTEQVEALETLALDPVRYLVAPRFLSLLVMLPCLIMIGDIAGILGGYTVGTLALGIRGGLYLEVSFDALMAKDIFSGLFKSAIFSMIITLISCYQGLNTRGGAEGVGRATTVAVVLSFIFIILADAVLTFLFYFTGS
ncbi:MAG: phospholipid/cholesterol/gamma-HCH transport system permease protein [Candidatus Omnitrophota bacterium]